MAAKICGRSNRILEVFRDAAVFIITAPDVRFNAVIVGVAVEKSGPIESWKASKGIIMTARPSAVSSCERSDEVRASTSAAVITVIESDVRFSVAVIGTTSGNIGSREASKDPKACVATSRPVARGSCKLNAEGEVIKAAVVVITASDIRLSVVVIGTIVRDIGPTKGSKGILTTCRPIA